jgi:hypothetical protein
VTDPIEQSITDKVFHAYVPCPDCDGCKPLPHPVQWIVALNDPDICVRCRGWGWLPCNHAAVQMERIRRGLDMIMMED